MYTADWDDVLLPGKARRCWEGGRLRALLEGAETGSYDRGVARAMAWLSWGAYAEYAGEGGKAALHAAMGVEERFFVDVVGVQCSLLWIDGMEDVVVVFRGSVGLMPWVYNVGVVPRSWEGAGKVHSGFATAWRSVWKLLEPRLAGRRVWATGHSLGGALAVLSVGMLEGSEGYVFGAPMVGNEVYAAAYAENRCLWRCVLGADGVSRLPLPVKGVERFSYSHVGIEIPLQSGVVSRRDGALSMRELKVAFEGKRPPPVLSDHAVGNYLWALE